MELMKLMEIIKSAGSEDRLNAHGLAVSRSFLDEEEKKPYYDAIEERRKALDLTREGILETGFDSNEYYYNEQDNSERYTG